MLQTVCRTKPFFLPANVAQIMRWSKPQVREWENQVSERARVTETLWPRFFAHVSTPTLFSRANWSSSVRMNTFGGGRTWNFNSALLTALSLLTRAKMCHMRNRKYKTGTRGENTTRRVLRVSIYFCISHEEKVLSALLFTMGTW